MALTIQDIEEIRKQHPLPQAQPVAQPSAGQTPQPKMVGNFNVAPVVENMNAAGEQIDAGLAGIDKFYGTTGAKYDTLKNPYDPANRKIVSSELAKMLVSLPREIPKAVVRFGYATANLLSFGAIGKKPMNIPFLGEIQTPVQTMQAIADENNAPKSSSITQTLWNQKKAIWGGVLQTASDALVAYSGKDLVAGALKKPGVVAAGMDTGAVVKSAMAKDGLAAEAPAAAAKGVDYLKITDPALAKKFGGSTHDTYFKVAPASLDGKVEVSVVTNRRGIFESKKNFTPGQLGPEKKLFSEVVDEWRTPAGERSEPLNVSIPPKPIPGTENMPIAPEHISNLKAISEFNKLSPEASDIIVKAATGKTSIADMTGADYVNAAKALGNFSEAAKYSGEAKMSPLFNVSRWVSPRRYWMRDVEASTPYKPYTDVYVPVENAAKTTKIFHDGMMTKSRETVWKTSEGKDYSLPQYAEEQRLVFHHNIGDPNAITNNPNLTPDVKADLLGIAERNRAHLEEMRAMDPDDVNIRENYQPQVRYNNGVWTIYKEGANRTPVGADPFFEKYRGGMTEPVLDNALALEDIYAGALSRKLYMNPALESSAEAIKLYPDTVKMSTNAYLQEKMGYAGKIERMVNEVATEISKTIGKDLPANWLRGVFNRVMQTTYSGALGARPVVYLRNMFDGFFTSYGRLGGKFMKESWEKATDPAYIAKVRDEGIIVEHGVPYGGAVAEADAVGSKIGRAYDTVINKTMHGQKWTDQTNRVRIYAQGEAMFNDALARMQQGKLSYSQFERESGISGMSKPDRMIVQKMMVEGDTKGAFSHFIRDVIDETNFPFRKASSAAITDGMAGKVGFQFAQWPIEYAHMLGSWVKRGQWDNLARFAGIAETARRTMDNIADVDISKWSGLRALKPSASPAVRFGENLYKALSGNNDEVNSAWQEIWQSITALGVPAGVQINKLKDLNRNIELSKKDPTINTDKGEFAVWSKNGKKIYNTTFADLLWTALGFPTNPRKEQTELTSETIQSSQRMKSLKDESLKLYYLGKTKEAEAMWVKYGIKPTANELSNYLIPQSQRYFKTLSPEAQVQYAPKIFNK